MRDQINLKSMKKLQGIIVVMFFIELYCQRVQVDGNCSRAGGMGASWISAEVQQKVEELEKRYAELIRSAEKSADEDSSLVCLQPSYTCLES